MSGIDISNTFYILTKEETLQVAVADYLRMQYPKAMFCHVANERQTSPQRGAKLKRMGVKSGIPDILIFNHNYSKDNTGELIAKNNYGLAIELKIKPNKPSENQIQVLNDLDVIGWRVAVVYNFDSAKKLIDNYFHNK